MNYGSLRPFDVIAIYYGVVSERMKPTGISALANVEYGAKIGDGSRVWDHTHIRKNAIVGDNCTIGENVYVGPGVLIGENSKIQNGTLIYEPAKLGRGVFLGPGVILTNDKYPRAISPDGALKTTADWEAVGVEIGDGASVGAGAVCIAPVSIGNWSMIAAGSIVVADVPAYALVVGNPARQIAWIGRDGKPLKKTGANSYFSPTTDYHYTEISGSLIERPLE
jgi:UDP-2-acetamido-3-amino-2,3-dideoxy-glucuronate N-acetyltransferase